MPLYNDALLIRAILKHYQSASRIIFFDMGSTDDGPQIAISGNREVIFVENKFDDLINIKIKNEAWKDLATDNDYVIVQDTDELIFFPDSPNDIISKLYAWKCNFITHSRVESYAIIMEDEEWLQVDTRLTRNQHPTLSFTNGTREDPICLEMNLPPNLYDKPMIFDPNSIRNTNFFPGQHEWAPEFIKTPKSPSARPVMLHCRYLGRNREKLRTQQTRDRLKHQFHLGMGIQYNVTDDQLDNRIKNIYNAKQKLNIFPGFIKYVSHQGANDFLLALNRESDFISQSLIAGKTWEPAVSSAIASLSNKNSLFIDIGANIGIHALTAANCGSSVIAFEPHPANFELLTKAVFANGWDSLIKCYQLAVSDKDRSTMKLFDDPNNMGGSSLHRNFNHETFFVLTSSIDAQKINFSNYENVIIKIDVEGHENYVLKGMLDTLNNSKLNAIFIEFNKSLVTTQDLLSIYSDLLDYGFHDCRVLLNHPKDSWSGDALPTHIPDFKVNQDELSDLLNTSSVVLELLFLRY